MLTYVYIGSMGTFENVYVNKKILSLSQSKSKSKFPLMRSAMSYKLHFYMGKKKRSWFFFQIMSETVLSVTKFEVSSSYTHAHLWFPCSFWTVNHHNNKNWVPPILTHNLWLICNSSKTGKKCIFCVFRPFFMKITNGWDSIFIIMMVYSQKWIREW